jgi:hypothetical protein
MSDEQHIKLKKDTIPEKEPMDNKVLAEEGDVIVWYEQYAPGEKVIFINIGNATVSMPEQVFYTLTKLTQDSTKKLLNLD